MAGYSKCDCCTIEEDFEFSEVYIDEEDVTLTLCPKCEEKFI
jgi:NAD-dependent SIR2 family protein deacetylase